MKLFFPISLPIFNCFFLFYFLLFFYLKAFSKAIWRKVETCNGWLKKGRKCPKTPARNRIQVRRPHNMQKNWSSICSLKRTDKSLLVVGEFFLQRCTIYVQRKSMIFHWKKSALNSYILKWGRNSKIPNKSLETMVYNKVIGKV